MDEVSKEYLITCYDKSLSLHGDRPEALRWTAAGQIMRYNLMLEIAPSLEGMRLLDYGCGKGDFYGFLKEKSIRADYTGMDINPRLIELAASKYPECRFKVFDIEEEDMENDEMFDFVFLCGVFNTRIEGATETMKNVVSKLFAHTGNALAVNALSTYSPKKERELNYVSPEEMVRFSLENLTPYVSLRHESIPYDMTLFLYKKPPTPTLAGDHQTTEPA